MSASKQASKRLQKEHVAFQKSPPPFVWARPNEANILEWHYILRGPPDTPYHGGEYWGVVTFPPDYPFAPPGIKVSSVHCLHLGLVLYRTSHPKVEQNKPSSRRPRKSTPS